MKISMNWLNELVDVDVTIEELSALYNKHSAEVEEFYKLVEATNVVVGHVDSIEKHPDADKLSVCQVNIGTKVSQIVCGAPNVDKGQNVIVALPGAVLPGGFKIKESTIRGIDSNGMICSLGELGIDKKYFNEDGIHVLPKTAVVGTDPIKELYFDDEVMVLDLTPNRADLLSVLGAAYDTAALLDKELILKEYIVSEEPEKNTLKIELDTDNCPAYTARVIKNIEINESPKWMQARLIAAGMRPINNVVDITNYVMLETGQPLHAFDYDLLNTDIIKVRMAHEKETIITLDEKQRVLTSSDIVITDGEKVVALGGVMGGFDTEVVPTTTAILLESAVFNPVSIRKTSNRLDLRSEASTRFERKVDPARTKLALEMATCLFIEYASGKVLSGISEEFNIDLTEKQIPVTLEKINRVLGSSLSIDEVSNIFDRLNFEYKLDDTTFNMSAPTRRQDLVTYQDIVEEVGRMIGYDNLPSTLPTTISIGKLSEEQTVRRKIKNTLNGLGLDEAVTYSLVSEETANDFDIKGLKPVALSKPMSNDRSVLSLTPLTSLIEVVKYNNARKINDVAVFTVGKEYQDGKESLLLAGAITGEYSNVMWQGKREVADFFILKGIITSLLNELSLGHLDFVKTDKYNNLHPGQSAQIVDRTGTVGFIGKLHPEYAKNNDLKDVYVFELELDKIIQLRRPLKKVKDINKFPIMQRDIAVIVNKDVQASEIINVIKKVGKRMLLSANVFDLYLGENIGLDNKSLAIRMEFSDLKRTLEAKEVDERVNEILGILDKKLGAKLR